MNEMSMTIEQFEEYCKNHTAKEAADLLARYIDEDQPDSFMPNASSRLMCGIAADCFYGRYGGCWDYMNFYNYMWGDRDDPMDETQRELRKARHLRCGIEVEDAS